MEERFESLPDLLREIGKRQSKLQSKNKVLDPLPPHQSKSGQKKKKKSPFFFIISILSSQTLQVWSSVAWRSIREKKKRKKKPKKSTYKTERNFQNTTTQTNKQTNNASTTIYRKKTEPEPEVIPKFRAVYMRQKTHTQSRSIDRSVQRRRFLLLSCLRRILCKTKCHRWWRWWCIR